MESKASILRPTLLLLLGLAGCFILLFAASFIGKSSGFATLAAYFLISALSALYLSKNKAFSKPRAGLSCVKRMWPVPIAIAVNLIFGLGEFAGAEHAGLVPIALLSSLLIAVWEELFYRGIGAYLFKRECGYVGPKAMIALSLVFGLSHLINAVSAPEALPLYAVQAAMASAVGFFMLALYMKSKNLLLPIIAHFLINLSSQLPSALFTPRIEYGGPVFWATYIGATALFGAACIYAGRALLKSETCLPANTIKNSEDE